MLRSTFVALSLAVLIPGCAGSIAVQAVFDFYYPETPVIQSELISLAVHIPQSKINDGIYGPFLPLAVEITNRSDVAISLQLQELKLRAAGRDFLPQTLSTVKGAYPKQEDVEIRKRISNAFLRPGQIKPGETKKGTVYYPEKAASKITEEEGFKIIYSNLEFIFLKKK